MSNLGSEMLVAPLPEPFDPDERATVIVLTTAELAERRAGAGA